MRRAARARWIAQSLETARDAGFATASEPWNPAPFPATDPGKQICGHALAFCGDVQYPI